MLLVPVLLTHTLWLLLIVFLTDLISRTHHVIQKKTTGTTELEIL